MTNISFEIPTWLFYILAGYLIADTSLSLITFILRSRIKKLKQKKLGLSDTINKAMR